MLLSLPAYASSSDTQKLTNGAVGRMVAIQDQQPQDDAVVHVEPVNPVTLFVHAARNEMYDELVREPKKVWQQFKAMFVGDKPFSDAFWEFITGGDEQED